MGTPSSLRAVAFDDGVAEDSLHGLAADARTGVQDHSGLTVGLGGLVGVDVDGDLGRWGIVGAASWVKATAFRQEDEPRLPSGRRGRESAISEMTLSRSMPPGPSNPPQSFHQDSSRDRCRTRN